MTGKADAVRAVSQQFKDRTNAVIEGVMAHLRDDNAKEILGPGLSPLIGRGSLQSIVTFALYADVLRMVQDMVMADGEISEEEVQESLGLLSVLAAGFAKVQKEYAAFAELSPESARPFLLQYKSDGGLFGHANQTTKWSGVELCRSILNHCGDPRPLDVFGDSLLAWAQALAASDATAESEHNVLDALQSITKRPGRILTIAVAEQFLGDPKSVNLKQFEVLEDAASEILAVSRESLHLDGLIEVSETSARNLGPHVGAISLGACCRLTNEAAAELSNHIGPLREVDLGNFVSDYPVFMALRRHPSLVAEVLWHESLDQILKTKDIDVENDYEFSFADARSKMLHDEEYYGDPMSDGLQLLADAEGRPVWHVDLSSVEREWVSDAGEYTLYFIGELDEVQQRLRALPDMIITKKIAARAVRKPSSVDLSQYYGIRDSAAAVLAEYDEDLYLDNVASVSDAAAESLSRHQGTLGLTGLTSLSDAAAESLSKHKGELVLDGLTSLTDAAAESLSRHQDSLSLTGLASLSGAAAESLSRHKDALYLDGLTSLSDAAAESLSRHQGYLRLPGLTSLTDAAAESLSRHQDWLSLTGLTSLSDAAAESLSRHQDALYLDGLTSLSDAAAESLSKHKGELVLDGLTSLTDAAAESLSRHQGYLALDGLTSLSDAAAESLSRHQGYLRLRGLTSLTDAAAEGLSRHKDSLSLTGLTSLSDAAAESLSRHQDALYLDGLTSLSDAAAESLSRHQGVLRLAGLTSLSDAAAESLSRHQGYVSLTGLTSLCRRATSLLRSNENIELSNKLLEQE